MSHFSLSYMNLGVSDVAQNHRTYFMQRNWTKSKLDT